ncbi:hypothetical protein Sste5346_004785 [Sporothrix stenoceras]|uniref:Stress-response A/B barrel domain-containing protein n=1 Tax=Sporothrix stenoceras TaxID=5173 RepID=A0ABR3Z802_9PEZI
MLNNLRIVRSCIAVCLILVAIVGLVRYQSSSATPFSPSSLSSSSSSPSSSSPTMSVVHTVLFQFSADADPEKVKETCRHFISLKAACVSATTSQPYILSIKGGKDNSPEGLQGGITHGFVVEFASAADRDYYVKTDPAHQAFVKSLDGLVTKAVVVDFSNGEY